MSQFVLDVLCDKQHVVAAEERDEDITVYVKRKLKMDTINRYIRNPKSPWTRKDIIPGSVTTLEEDDTTVMVEHDDDLGEKKVTVIEIGEVTAVTTPFRQMTRPVYPGVEISEPRSFEVGTLGGFCKYYSVNNTILTGRMKSFVRILDRMGIDYFTHYGFITNKHVVNKSMFKNTYPSVVQPGGNNISFSIGKVLVVSDVKKDQTNELDCSLCSLDREFINKGMFSGKDFKQLKTIWVGDKVQKEGRTTRHTKGKCVAKQITSNVNFREGPIRFKDLIMCELDVRGGDSGSFLRDKDDNIVGLIFAASPTMAFAMPIQKVVDYLGVDLV
jgi:hypothetical protein